MNTADLTHLDEESRSLVEMLRSDSLEDRLVGAVSLQHLGDEDTIPFLIEALDDPSDDVQLIAVTTLWELAHQSAVRPLTRCLEGDRSPRVREEALAALKELVNQDHLLMLLDLLAAGDPAQQLAVLILVRKIHDVQALPAISPFLTAKAPELRREAVITLRYLNQVTHFPPALALANDPDDSVRQETMLTLAHLDEPSVVPILCERLRDDQAWNVRRNAAQALEAKSDPSARTALVEGIHDSHWQVRKFALRALAGIMTPEHVGRVIPLLCDEYSDVRKEAAVVLGRSGAAQACAALKQAESDSDIEVRIAAGKSLRLLSDRPAAAGEPQTMTPDG
jgi:HEAT repeat protein